MRKRLKLLLRQGVAASTALGMIAMQAGSAGAYGFHDPNAFPTTTPIKHVVVIFGENISFDHYFGTYPYAANPSGEPNFTPSPWTPNVNGLNGPLLNTNPNFLNTTGNGTGGGDKLPPLPPKMPFELRRAMEQHVQRAAMQEGDRPLPQAGLLFFQYRGKAEGIRSLELIYSGAAGKASLDLQP